MKQDGVIVTTENDKHLGILRDEGTLSAEHRRKPGTETREQGKRINNLTLETTAAGWGVRVLPGSPDSLPKCFKQN